MWGGGVLPAVALAMDVDIGPWLRQQSLGVELQLQALVYDILPSFLQLGGRCRKAVLGVWLELQLQAQVYDILPSTTAVFRCAIGSRKLLANEQFFCWCSSSSKFVTNNSDYIRYNLSCL